MSAPLVFMDTETTGLSLDDDIWEFAAIRRAPDGTQTETHLFIHHDRAKCDRLPLSFRDDHYDRFRDHRAVTQREAANQIYMLLRGSPEGVRAHVVGAVPNFDTERIAKLLLDQHVTERPPWHHHLIDVEALMVGHLLTLGNDVELPWDSDELSDRIGVTPSDFDRHTAMGDVRWAMAIYDMIAGGAS